MKINNEDINGSQDNSESNGIYEKRNPYRAFFIVVIAVSIVAGVSFLPLEKLTNGRIKDFSLLSDLIGISADTDTIVKLQSSEGLDPELIKAMSDGVQAIDAPKDSSVMLNSSAVAQAVADTALIAIKPSRVGDQVMIEDYTSAQAGLLRLRSALSSGRLARIAFIGDSYIEGDIFTQDLRDQLQTVYGGKGVGYVNMYSEFPGFRRSVKQSGSGWTEYVIGKNGDATMFGIAQHFYKPTVGANANYKGMSTLRNTSSWDNSQFLFVASQPTTVTVKTSGREWTTFEVKPSKDVQRISINAPTSEFSVKASSPSLNALGVWLDGNRGVSLDCMSSRGFSGLTLSKVDADLCRSMSKYINYDLIVLEFGINAMSSKQTDYSIYAKKMIGVVEHVRNCYPNADILILGIGDRGEKKVGEVKSMASGKNMIDAQREVARRTHSLFWNTREAMGGDGAIADWAKNGMANKDYVHLTHKGGKELASRLSTAIRQNLKR